MLRQRPHGLDEDGIGEQPGEASEVARRVEKVRILRSAAAAVCKPVLQGRGRRRDHNEDQASRSHEHRQQPAGGIGLARNRLDGPSERDRQRQRAGTEGHRPLDAEDPVAGIVGPRAREERANERASDRLVHTATGAHEELDRSVDARRGLGLGFALDGHDVSATLLRSTNYSQL